jgi:hypothetical protein
MGTTLTALQSGSLAYQYVVAIEGYPYLLTDGSTAAAVTAWSGTDWTQALDGLYVELNNEQRLDPWAPVQQGGNAILRLQPDATDQFGKDYARSSSGAETYLKASLGRTDTTITVASTTGFASSGEAFIGNECFSYSATTATTFTVTARGKYSPFGASSGTRFALNHRVGFVDYATLLEPVVSQYARSWAGRSVGIWMHRKVGGVLDVKAQAQLVFVGKIGEISDDANNGHAVISVDHLFKSISETVLLRDQWKAQLAEGVYIRDGQTVATWVDVTTTTANVSTTRVATSLVGKTGATLTYQIEPGYYGPEAICSALNTWLDAERSAGRLAGYYVFNSPFRQDGWSTSRTLLGYYSTVSYSTKFAGGLIGSVSLMLGFSNAATVNPNNYHDLGDSYLSSTGPYQLVSPNAPSRYIGPAYSGSSGSSAMSLSIVNVRGTLIDQTGHLPYAFPGLSQNALLLLNDKWLLVGQVTATEVLYAFQIPTSYGLTQSTKDDFQTLLISVDDALVPELKQVVSYQSSFADNLKRLFYSTGTAAYNDATYDDVAFKNVSLQIPAALLGSLQASIDLLPGASSAYAMILEKPTKWIDLITVDLVLRRSHLIWRNGSFKFVSWSTPSAAQAIYSLTEANKAAPADSTENHRSVVALSSQWRRDTVKILYNRLVSTGEYTSTLTLEDRTSIDDNGGTGAACTLEARNVYVQSAGLGTTVEQLAPAFLAWMPYFSRPVRILTRSIDATLFEACAVGDVVTVTDKFARDPSTGARGISGRPGLIVRHRWSPGGPTPGSPWSSTPMTGEVDVVFLDLDRTAVYAPAAQVDDTANAGGFSAGYNSGTLTMRCYAHEHSEASAAVDAASFVATDVVTIVEIDPAAAASPLSWTRTIASVSGSDIVLTAALSAPAWDATKKYRIIPTGYTGSTATQKAKVYEASSTSGKIASTAVPYLYGYDAQGSGYTARTHVDLPERRASASYGDGVPLDVGYERGIVRTVNNLIDHKTAHNSPFLGAEQSYTKGASSTNYVLVMIAPMYLGTMTLTSDVARYLYVAPLMRSLTGASATVKVTLSRYPCASASRSDVTFSAPYTTRSFSTTSTTYVTSTEQSFDLSIVGDNGIAYLHVEVGDGAATRGLAQAIERERS